MLDLERPLDWFLQSGGDHRQKLLPDTGLTRYRTSPTPRPGVSLGSCTGSWTSPRSWQACEVELAAWRGQADSETAIDAGAHRVRHRLAAALGLDSSERIVLSPSGTDVVYMVSAFALEGVERVHHVVVGASELGGGTLAAARGLTFSPQVPHVGEVPPGTPVEGLAGRCTAEPLYLRHASGERMAPDEVDAAVTAAVDAAVAPDCRVVLHLVAHSKTGLRAPSLSAARALAEAHGDKVLVLVDAAQGRLAPHDVRHAIELGFIVLFTGSKFYSGPPFSGGLVLPFTEDPGPLPRGVGGWFSRADLPRTWTVARASLDAPHNPGLVLRWVAALAELEAYHAIEPRLRGRIYHTFAGAVLESFGPSTLMEVDVPMPPVHRLVTALGAYPSVFGFRVFDGAEPLDAEALRRLHALIDTDLGHVDPALAERFHLGQPVSLGPPRPNAPAVLRVALGARLVTDLAHSPDAGAAWLRERLGALVRKVEILVRSGMHREDA